MLQKTFSSTKIIGFIFLSLLAVQGIISFAFDIVRVDARQVAVVTQMGQIADVRGAGWHLKTPYISAHSATYNLSVISNSVKADSATKDQQSIQIEANLQYQLKADKIKDIYLKIGGTGNGGVFADDKIDAIIDPILNESVKSSSANFTASEIISQREQLKKEIENNLNDKLKDYDISVITVNIANVEFSTQFKQAIENKVTAQQRAEQSKFEQDQARTELETEKIKSEALSIRGQALQLNPQILEEQKIQKWDGKLPTVTGSNGTFVNLQP